MIRWAIDNPCTGFLSDEGFCYLCGFALKDRGDSAGRDGKHEYWCEVCVQNYLKRDEDRLRQRN